MTGLVTLEEGQTTTSITGLLSSPAFASALQGLVDPTTLSTYRDFLLSTTLHYTGWRDPRSPPQRLSAADLHLIGNMTGSSLLRRLEQLLLAPDALGEASRPTIQALLCMLLGTILGVKYTTSPWISRSSSTTCNHPLLLSGGGGGGGVMPSRDFSHSPTQWLMKKERLCQMLANELITLAKALGSVSDEKTEMAVMDGLTGTTTRRGTHPGREQWVWGNVLLPSSDPTPGLGYCHGQMPNLPQSPRRGGDSRYLDGPSDGTFYPRPQPTMLAYPEIMSSELPRPDPLDGRKRRSMIVVGPCDGHQIYAHIKVPTSSGYPRMIV